MCLRAVEWCCPPGCSTGGARASVTEATRAVRRPSRRCRSRTRQRCPREPRRLRLSGYGVVAVPDVAGHEPRVIGLPLVDREVLAGVADGASAGLRGEGDRVRAPLEGPV